MSKPFIGLAAAALLSAVVMPAAVSATVQQPGLTNATTTDISARRYHHRYRAYRPYYRYGYRRYWGSPYYAYAPRPYYYGYGPRYYGPGPWPFFGFGW